MYLGYFEVAQIRGVEVNEEEYLSTKDAMEYLGVGRSRLYKLIGQGKLKAYKNADYNPHLTYFSKAEMDAVKEAKAKPKFVTAEELKTQQDQAKD
jgi:predicted DNA-binding transcriptional regulator AlpA